MSAARIFLGCSYVLVLRWDTARRCSAYWRFGFARHPHCTEAAATRQRVPRHRDGLPRVGRILAEERKLAHALQYRRHWHKNARLDHVAGGEGGLRRNGGIGPIAVARVALVVE